GPTPTAKPKNTPNPNTQNTPTPENTPTPKPGAVTADNLDEYLETLLDKHGRSLRAIYDYVHDGFTFRSTVKSDVTTMACRILNTGSGSCWDYAALTSLLLKKAGYNCQIIVGVGAVASEHNWVIVEVEPGVWRHMDTQHTKETFLLTDEELEARNGKSPYVNYEWDKSKYPKAE
ncbi:MAG: transglutaminase-like domain-containing protein, partial [Lachnospiraceae bacterium]|nr:transglutaminase-like domain-containing protein [Lachnospiraceae bacterium]